MRVIQYNIEKRRLTLENIRLRREIEREYSFAGIVGTSEEILAAVPVPTSGMQIRDCIQRRSQK